MIPFVFVLGLADYAFAVDAEIRSATIPPVIDGIKEDAWSASKEHKCVNTVAGDKPRSDTDFSCGWWALWDSKYLYVFVDVNDEDLQNDSASSYEDDSVEIYIDIGNDKRDSYGDDDYQYRAAWSTQVPEIGEHYHSAKSLAGVEFTVRKTDANDGYTLEIKFPWTALMLKGNASPDDLLGFTVLINDDDGGGSRDTQLAWQKDTGEAWDKPSLFGTVRLVSSPGPGPSPGPSPSSSLKASNPNPSDGAEGVVVGIMQWTAGANAKSYNVYFGSNPAPGKDEFRGNQTGTVYYHLAGFEPGTTYYWRIDGVNDANIWPGDVWHFTTAPLAGKQP